MIESKFGGVACAVFDLFTHGRFSVPPSRRHKPIYNGEHA